MTSQSRHYFWLGSCGFEPISYYGYEAISYYKVHERETVAVVNIKE